MDIFNAFFGKKETDGNEKKSKKTSNHEALNEGSVGKEDVSKEKFEAKKIQDTEGKRLPEKKESTEAIAKTNNTSEGLNPKTIDKTDLPKTTIGSKAKDSGINPNVKSQIIGENDGESLKSPHNLKGADPFSFQSYRRTQNKKLTVILLENTKMVYEHKDIISKIIKSSVTSGLACIINYGSKLTKSAIFDIEIPKDISLFNEDDLGDKACLYNAFLGLEELIWKKYLDVIEIGHERVRINQIEIIGIGTCKDNSSTISKFYATYCLSDIIKKAYVTTKYFCLTEDYFLNAAELGFRSIGAILRKY